MPFMCHRDTESVHGPGSIISMIFIAGKVLRTDLQLHAIRGHLGIPPENKIYKLGYSLNSDLYRSYYTAK